jgi:fructan beta-fructosidase
MLDERYRPRFHFTPPTGWMNDPNGPVYFEGEYHLFYQHLRPLHWGHAVSTDLVHWTHLPIALYPDDLGDIYSGNAVVDLEDRSGFFGGRPGLVAIFTHNNKQQAPPLGPQVQSLAYSSDRGRTWTMYAQNPVIANPGITDFRDPKVFWHAASRQWVLVLACHDRVHFYRSPTLKDWTFASEFGAGQGAPIVPWECPDLFELPVEGDPARRKWVLQVSVHPRQERAAIPDCRDMQYFIGEFDGYAFRNDNPPSTVLWTEYGRDNYADVSWSDMPPTDGRRIWIGWMNNWDYARVTPTAPWQGAMTLPRQVTLGEGPQGLQIRQTPVAELQTLRADVSRWSNRAIAPTASVVAALPSGGLEIEATFRLESATAFGLNLCTALADHTSVEYDAEQQQLCIDRTHSGETSFHADFPGRHGGPLAPSDGTIFLHVFVDTCSVEVFGNDGAAVITSLIFPRAAFEQLEIYAVNGIVRLVSLAVFRLNAADPMAGASAAAADAAPAR